MVIRLLLYLLSTDNGQNNKFVMNIYIVTERSSSHRIARNRFLSLFLCPPKNKDQRAQHKNRSRFLLVYVCVCSFFFFFFSGVLRHLLLWLRLQQSASSSPSSSRLPYYTRSLRSCRHHHSFIHSFTSVHSSSHLAIRQRTEIINKVV